MSYILDALKKSEAERARGMAPSLLDARPVHAGPRIAMWVLLAALLGNAAIGAFWMFSPDTIVVRAPVVASAPRSTETSQSSPTRSADASASAITATEQTRAQPQASHDSTAVATPEMELANLTFSTHVYAADPSMRAVTLNGRRLVEGDAISKGVRLQEITETGVVLNVHGRVVPLEVLQDWR